MIASMEDVLGVSTMIASMEDVLGVSTMIASMEDVLGVSTKVLLVGSSTIASMEDVLWLSNEHRKCSGQVSTEVNRSTCSKTVCGRRNCDLVDVICEVASCCVE